MTEKVRANSEDRENARAEKFLVAMLTSLEPDPDAPMDDFELACLNDPELKEIKEEFRAFLLGPYLGAQARKGAFVRAITGREAQIRDEVIAPVLETVPDKIDYGPERLQPGAGNQIRPSRFG
jgi:hypothetical protein